MNKKTYLIQFGLAVLISIILLTQTSVAAFKNVTVGSTAPNLTLNDINGNEVSLEKIYNDNQIVILVFWSTWSPRSINELKDLQKLYDSYKEKGIEVVAVNVENETIGEEDVAKIKTTLEENEIKFTVLLDQGLSSFYSYGVVAIPSTAIIKKEGEMIKDYASYATFARDEIKDNVEYELGIKERPKDVEVAEASKKYKPIKASTLHYGLGKTLIARGMPDKAIREFLKASELDPKFDQPHVLLAELYYDKANSQKKKDKKAQYLKDAKGEYLKALEMNPDNLPALSGLGLVLIEEKNEVEAEQHINKALTLEPNFTPALSAMGILFKNKGERENAIEKFNMALELNPNQPEIHYLMALTYKDSGDEKLAIDSFKKAFQILVKQVSLAMSQEEGEK